MIRLKSTIVIGFFSTEIVEYDMNMIPSFYLPWMVFIIQRKVSRISVAPLLEKK